MSQLKIKNGNNWENIPGGGDPASVGLITLTTADWTAIYRQAGMSDKEIAEYRKENELTPGQKAALNDQVEQYNS